MNQFNNRIPNQVKTMKMTKRKKKRNPKKKNWKQKEQMKNKKIYNFLQCHIYFAVAARSKAEPKKYL